MPLKKVTIEDQLIHDIDKMIKELKLRRAAIIDRMPVVGRQRPHHDKIVHNGREYDFESCTSRKKKVG